MQGEAGAIFRKIFKCHVKRVLDDIYLPHPLDICGLRSGEAAENLSEIIKFIVYKYLITVFTILQQHSFGWGGVRKVMSNPLLDPHLHTKSSSV